MLHLTSIGYLYDLGPLSFCEYPSIFLRKRVCTCVCVRVGE